MLCKTGFLDSMVHIWPYSENGRMTGELTFIHKKAAAPSHRKFISIYCMCILKKRLPSTEFKRGNDNVADLEQLI